MLTWFCPQADQSSLQYIRRDLRFINEFIDAGATLTEKQAIRLGVIRILFDQQDPSR